MELVGDARKFTKALTDAGDGSKSFGDKVDSTANKMTAFVSVPIVGFLAAATKAAAEDQAGQASLAQTLANTTGNSKQLVAQVEQYITKAQKVSTFTDDELRPAFENLVRVTHNAQDANSLLSLSMDVAAAKHIDLETASKAVAKAHEGNFAAVNKLVPGLVDMKDKTLTANEAMGQLASTFSGSAKAATETAAGKTQMMTRDMGELTEKIGGQVLPVVEKMTSFMVDSLIPTLDKMTGDNGALVLMGVAMAGPVLKAIKGITGGLAAMNVEATTALGALGGLGIIAGGVNVMKHDWQKSRSAGDNLWTGLVKDAIGNGFVTDILTGKFFGGLAAGGPARAGTPYIVGEQGPELFVPGANGMIVPNGAGGMGGGGGGTIVNVVVQGSVLTERELGDVVHNALLRKQQVTNLGFAS